MNASRARIRMVRIPTAVLVIALAAASIAAAEPADPDRHYLGMNANFATSWASDHPFADVARVSRMVTLGSWSEQPPRDADGYPTSDFRWIFLEANSRPGTYKLVFTGQATVTPILGSGTIANQAYAAETNTTTADIIVTRIGANAILDFTQTRRLPGDAAGNGTTGLHIYQPGSPTDGSRLLGEAFTAQVRRAHILRLMNWQGANGNGLVHWSERTRPGSFTGVAIEHLIRAANETASDLWICLPVKADDEAVRKTAQAILFGTDGSEPYAAPVADPVHLPLAAGLKVYVEYGNEIWNSAGGFNNFYWIKDFADAVRISSDPHPIKLGDAGDADQWMMLGRYWAWRAAECSKIIRQVAGDAAMMTQVRPVLECQIGGGWLEKMIPFLKAYYGAGRDPSGRHPISHYFYGLGGTCYFYADETAFAASKNPDDYFSSINWTNLSDRMAAEAVWARDAGIKHVLYEGGNHPTSGSTITDADWRTIISAPKAYDMIVECQRRLDGAGVDLATYFQITGGSWGFTPSIDVTDSPKYNAIDTLMTASRGPCLIGTAVPGTVDVYATSPRQGSGWGNAAESTITINSNGYLVFLVHADQAGAFTMSFDARPLQNTQSFSIWVGGRRVSAVTLASGTYAQTATATVQLPRGLSAIRLNDESRSGNWTGFRHIAFAAAGGPVNQAPQVSAGPALAVPTGGSLRIAAIASDDGLPQSPGHLTAAWTQISGPATATFTDAAVVAAQASFPAAGTYVLRLTVGDGEFTVSDDVQVVAVDGNLAPSAILAVPGHATVGVALPVSAAISDDGVPGTGVSAAWSATGPGHAPFADASAVTTTVTFPAPGTYTIRLVISDGVLRSAAERTVVVVVAGQGGSGGSTVSAGGGGGCGGGAAGLLLLLLAGLGLVRRR